MTTQHGQKSKPGWFKRRYKEGLTPRGFSLLAIVIVALGIIAAGGVIYITTKGEDAQQLANETKMAIEPGADAVLALCNGSAGPEIATLLQKDPNHPCQKTADAKAIEVPDPNDPEIQDDELQNPEIQDSEIQDEDPNDPDPLNDGDPNDQDPNDPEVQETEEQEPENQDPELQEDEIQEPEIQDGEVNDPDPGMSGFTFSYMGVDYVCVDQDGDTYYVCTASSSPDPEPTPAKGPN